MIEPFLPGRQVRPVPHTAAAAIRGSGVAVLHRRPVAGCAVRVRTLETAHNRFLAWRDAGVFKTLMDRTIAEAARRGQADMSLVSVDSTVVRAHLDAAGLRVSQEVLATLEEAAGRKGVRRRGR